MPMASKKFYSDDDIQLAKAALSELPDLTAQRKTLRDFLDAIRDDIIVLVRTKVIHWQMFVTRSKMQGMK